MKRPLRHVLLCLSLAAAGDVIVVVDGFASPSTSRSYSSAASAAAPPPGAAATTTTRSRRSYSLSSFAASRSRRGGGAATATSFDMSTSLETEAGLTLERRSSRRTRPTAPTIASSRFYDEDEADAMDEGEYDLEFEVSSFQQLQRSMGSEVLDETLQKQIDKTLAGNPNLFLDAHMSDASYIERIAMSSIPEQLPQPAVNALLMKRDQEMSGRRHGSSKKRQQQQQQGRDSGELKRSSSMRLNHDEELELGKMIQRGVALHKVKTEYETTHARQLSRSEWAKLAGVDSASQLRRDVANYRRAKQLLVSANIGLVHAVVKKKYGGAVRLGLASHDELVQEGSLGLMRAAELFDPSKGLRFSTYATIWIKGALGNSHVTEGIKIPDRDRNKWNKITKAHAELIEENGFVPGDDQQKPSLEQVAERVGMSVEDVVKYQQKMKQVKHVLSLDYEYKSKTRSGFQEDDDGVIEKDKSFQADADLAGLVQMQADILAALADNLNPREARLLRLRYGLTDGCQRTIKECAEAMGIGESYAQNLASSSIKKLRKAADADSLEEYLLTMA